ncbi:hypothetical protein HUJ05_006067 [Dendroctonus ponderosae]|nr:hypothetical protein HUJ05_006067 [Dendroctonus ponderosae]
MAALFADMKLSQTTDITHLVPAGFEVDRRNLYNMEKSLQAKYSPGQWEFLPDVSSTTAVDKFVKYFGPAY